MRLRRLRGGTRVTYYNTVLIASSFIDYIFVAGCLFDVCCGFDTVNSGCNLSASFKFANVPRLSGSFYTQKVLNWRWDKSNINNYYKGSRVSLSQTALPAWIHCNSAGCSDVDHLASIDRCYCGSGVAIGANGAVAPPPPNAKSFCNSRRSEKITQITEISLTWDHKSSFFHSKVVSVWGLRPETPTGAFAPGPHWGTSVPQTPWICSSRKDFLATPLYCSIVNALFQAASADVVRISPCCLKPY